MKKIIITISIILISITAAILLVVLWPNNMEEIKVTNYNNVVLDLGSIKATDFKRDSNHKISFEIENENEFYNDVIKKYEHYNKELDFEVENYYAYGYYVFDECIFNYMIQDNKVYIDSCYVIYKNTSGDEIKSYFVPGPFTSGYLTKYIFDEYGVDGALKMDCLINYAEFKKLMSYLPTKYCKLKDDSILMKGFAPTPEGTMIESDYELELFNNNDKAYVRLYNEGK